MSSIFGMSDPNMNPQACEKFMPRHMVDYTLQRRARLAEVNSGQITVDDVCDANPYLLTAATFHGTLSGSNCPICRKEPLRLVSWVFGDLLGQVSGSARSEAEINNLTRSEREFSVHVVEVCRTCRWNHLMRSYVSGLEFSPSHKL